MKAYVIYSSITHASSVKRALPHEPRLSLIHVPQQIPINTCAYALFVPISMLDSIIEESEKLGLPIRGIYDENYEELR